jgi:hypothetical protein
MNPGIRNTPAYVLCALAAAIARHHAAHDAVEVFSTLVIRRPVISNEPITVKMTVMVIDRDLYRGLHNQRRFQWKLAIVCVIIFMPDGADSCDRGCLATIPLRVVDCDPHTSPIGVELEQGRSKATDVEDFCERVRVWLVLFAVGEGLEGEPLGVWIEQTQEMAKLASINPFINRGHACRLLDGRTHLR